MPRLHALELVPDDVGETVVRHDWQTLREAGLPSMADHTGASNTPHVTLLALPAIGADLERRAVDALGALLPVVVDLLGYADQEIRLVALRRWDPELRSVRLLV